MMMTTYTAEIAEHAEIFRALISANSARSAVYVVILE